MSHQSVSQVARQLGIPPRLISDLFYLRKLDDRKCPIVAGRRLIPVSYITEVQKVLRAAGRLQEIAS
jgi:hypothetical protein